MNKKKQRLEMKKKRDSLSAAERKLSSSTVTEKIFSMQEFKNAKTIASFIPINSEIDIMPLNLHILNEKKLLALPFVQDDVNMVFKAVSSLKELKKDRKNIPAPGEEATEIPLNQIDLFIVPGLGFDAEKNRMGYGRGYYDRVLIRLKKNQISLSPAFEAQLTDKVEISETDIKVNIIVTEKRVII